MGGVWKVCEKRVCGALLVKKKPFAFNFLVADGRIPSKMSAEQDIVEIVDCVPPTQPPPAKRQYDGPKNNSDPLANQKWKAFLNKYALTYHFCKSCNDKLFKSKQKLTTDGDGYTIMLWMCKPCFTANVAINQVYYQSIQNKK